MSFKSLLFFPFTVIWLDERDETGEKISKNLIVYRYSMILILAFLLMSYPLVYYANGKIAIEATIYRLIFVYGYALFLALAAYSKNWKIQALCLAIFAIYPTIANLAETGLAIRAAFAWYFIIKVISDYLNQNYKNIYYNKSKNLIFVKKINDNVSIWQIMFYSALILSAELYIVISGILR